MIRLFTPDDPTEPVGWRIPSLIIATLFFNVAFWYPQPESLWMFNRPPVDVLVFALVGLAIATLFFLGPALATQALKRPLVSNMANSIGSIPAFILRLCCVLVLVLWIVKILSFEWGLIWYVWRDLSRVKSLTIATVTLLFAIFTGCQSLRISGSLSLFSIKLGVAILIAALIRVHSGWPAILKGFPLESPNPPVYDLWKGISILSFHLAPLMFVGASFGSRLATRRDVVMTALAGIAAPLAGSLLLLGVINVATGASRFYQPSLNANVLMALWNHASRSATAARMMIVGITLFGALRFGMRALSDVAPPKISKGIGWVPLIGLIVGTLLWSTDHPYTESLSKMEDYCVQCLTIASAILTADFLFDRRMKKDRKLDWVGLLAFALGLALPAFIRFWWYEWTDAQMWHLALLPSYAVAFLTCALLRQTESTTPRRKPGDSA